jgi:hypothetical protein
MDSCHRGHKTQRMGNEGTRRSGGEVGSPAEFGSEAVRKDPASRRASRVEPAGVIRRGDNLVHLGGLNGVVPRLHLDQLRPNALPVIRAQVPTTNGPLRCFFDGSAVIYWHATRAPVHNHLDRDADLCRELGQAREVLCSDVNCVVHNARLHPPLSFVNRLLNAAFHDTGTVSG